MLQITFGLFVGLFGGSWATIAFYKTTINMYVVSQKTENLNCLTEIKNSLSSLYEDFIGILESYNHCISAKIDKAKFLSSVLQNIIVSCALNFVFLIVFYEVCSMASITFKLKSEEIFNDFSKLSLVCFILWGGTLIFGMLIIYWIDKFEEFKKIVRTKDIKKAKLKL